MNERLQKELEPVSMVPYVLYKPSQEEVCDIIIIYDKIEIISNLKTTKMRYCQYSYGVNCVCFPSSFVFYASIVVDYVNIVVDYVDKKQHKMEHQKQLNKCTGAALA